MKQMIWNAEKRRTFRAIKECLQEHSSVHRKHAFQTAETFTRNESLTEGPCVQSGNYAESSSIRKKKDSLREKELNCLQNARKSSPSRGLEGCFLVPFARRRVFLESTDALVDQLVRQEENSSLISAETVEQPLRALPLAALVADALLIHGSGHDVIRSMLLPVRSSGRVWFFQGGCPKWMRSNAFYY